MDKLKTISTTDEQARVVTALLSDARQLLVTASHLAQERDRLGQSVRKHAQSELLAHTRRSQQANTLGELALTSLAAECALKALAAKTDASYLMVHDLHDLYRRLHEDVRGLIDRIAEGKRIPPLNALLEEHGRTLVDCGYHPDENGLSADPTLLQDAVDVLVRACVQVPYGRVDEAVAHG